MRITFEKNKLKLKGIYCVRNTMNDKRDIGQAGSQQGFAARYYRRKSDLNLGRHRNMHLQSSWNKYGANAFVFEILEIIEEPTKELLTEREQYWTNHYKSNNPAYGYNKKPSVDSNLGHRWTDEQRAAVSGENHPMTGKKRPKWVCEKIKEGWSEETKQRQSDRMKGEKNPRKNPNITKELKLTVKRDYAGGLSQTKIANKYGIGQSTVSRIIRGTVSKRVDGVVRDVHANK